MDMTTAVTRLRKLFDVTEKRYEPETALFHLNQACVHLSQDSDLYFDRYLVDYNLEALSPLPDDPMLRGAVEFSSLSKGAYQVGFIRGVHYYDTAAAKWLPLPSWSHREILDTLNDETGDTPNAVHVVGDKVLVRRIPTVDTLFRFEIKGKPSYIEEGANGWLVNAEFGVLYKAAEFAAIYLMEDKRVPGFKTLAEAELLRVTTDASMMVMNEPTEAREPG